MIFPSFSMQKQSIFFLFLSLSLSLFSSFFLVGGGGGGERAGGGRLEGEFFLTYSCRLLLLSF